MSTADRYLKQTEDGKEPTLVLISIDWSHADRFNQFRPRLSDGTQFHVTEARGEWSWFLTYVNQQGRNGTPVAVHVLRVRDTGEVSSLPWTRT